MKDMTEVKVFNIDGIKVSIPMALFKDACRVYVLEEETSEEEKYRNNIYIKGLIKSSTTYNLKDINKKSLDEIKNTYTDEQISKELEKSIVTLVKISQNKWRQLQYYLVEDEKEL